jgi:hypothetical protein
VLFKRNIYHFQFVFFVVCFVFFVSKDCSIGRQCDVKCIASFSVVADDIRHFLVLMIYGGILVNSLSFCWFIEWK